VSGKNAPMRMRLHWDSKKLSSTGATELWGLSGERRTMLVPRQRYPRELKITTMPELDSGRSTAEVARMYQLSPKRLETWRGEWRAKGELAFPGQGARPQAKLDAERIPELERKIGQQAMEIQSQFYQRTDQRTPAVKPQPGVLPPRNCRP